MTKAKTYGALLLVGTTAILAGGCGDKTEPVKQDAATQKAEAQYTPPKVDTKALLEKAKDGIFTGKVDGSHGSSAVMTITIQNHKIVASTFEGFDKNGNPKNEEYGKTNGKVENKVYYNKAQIAAKAFKSYADALVQVQELNKVDGISGATAAYKQFFDAAQLALENAGK